MKVIVYGAEGTMGKLLADQLTALTIETILVDPMTKTESIYASLNNDFNADVLIDFSHFSQTETLVNYALKTKLPLVIATTGHHEHDEKRFQEAAKTIPIFKSANMAFGIHLLHKILKEYTSLLEDAYDIEIIEKHHKHKIDAPSGTAYLLAKSIQAGSHHEKTILTNRSGLKESRNSHEIGISSVRGGTIVGEHTVSFIGESDIIELSHSAQSKKLFTEGALKAAYYIIKQKPGLYTMDDLVEERRG